MPVYLYLAEQRQSLELITHGLVGTY